MLTDKDKEKLDMMMSIYKNCLVLSSPPAHLVNRAEMLIAVSRGHRSGPFQIVRACSTLPTTDLCCLSSLEAKAEWGLYV